MSLSFKDQLIITVIDKLAIGVLLVIAAFIFNRLLEKFRSQRSLENELRKLRDARTLDHLDKQLSQFYWPIYIRLHIDSAVWENILDKRKEDPTLSKISAEIQKDFVLPNHEEIVRIIQSNIHLMESDDDLFEAMRSYVKHVAIYKAIRSAECDDKFPLELEVPWSGGFLTLISKTAHSLQNKYDHLVKMTNAT